MGYNCYNKLCHQVFILIDSMKQTKHIIQLAMTTKDVILLIGILQLEISQKIIQFLMKIKTKKNNGQIRISGKI